MITVGVPVTDFTFEFGRGPLRAAAVSFPTQPENFCPVMQDGMAELFAPAFFTIEISFESGRPEPPSLG
jgi:hypothetical protein